MDRSFRRFCGETGGFVTNADGHINLHCVNEKERSSAATVLTGQVCRGESRKLTELLLCVRSDRDVRDISKRSMCPQHRARPGNWGRSAKWSHLEIGTTPTRTAHGMEAAVASASRDLCNESYKRPQTYTAPLIKFKTTTRTNGAMSASSIGLAYSQRGNPLAPDRTEALRL